MVSRQTLHSWLARYEAEGLDGVNRGAVPATNTAIIDRNHRKHQLRIGRAGVITAR